MVSSDQTDWNFVILCWILYSTRLGSVYMDFLPPFQCVTFAMASSYIISNDTAWYSARRTGTWRDCVFNSHFQIDCVSSVHSAAWASFLCGGKTPLIHSRFAKFAFVCFRSNYLKLYLAAIKAQSSFIICRWPSGIIWCVSWGPHPYAFTQDSVTEWMYYTRPQHLD